MWLNEARKMNIKLVPTKFINGNGRQGSSPHWGSKLINNQGG